MAKWPTFLGGMFAGAMQTLVSSPVELLKIRLQLQTTAPGSRGYVGPLSMARDILRREGLRGEGCKAADPAAIAGMHARASHGAVFGARPSLAL